MERVSTQNRLLISVASMAVIGVFYLSINRIVDPSLSVPLPLPIDRRIPLVPVFIIPYVLYYPAIALGPFFCRTRNEVRRLLGAYAIVLLISGLFYIMAVVRMERPPLPTEGGLFLDMVRFVYSSDVPVNCFPSQHAAFITSVTVAMKGRKSFPLWIVLCILVLLSTLFVKQHWLVDIVFGVAVGLYAYRVARYF